MKRKYFSLLAAGLLFVGSTATAFAATLVTYEFTFTGQQLMSYTTADGVFGPNAADNGIYNGARLGGGEQKWENPGIDGSSRSYVASENADFIDWRNNTSEKLVQVNLWGHGGNAANWGEKYKVHDWGNTPTVSRPGWNPFFNTTSDGELLTWDTYDESIMDYVYADGLGFGPGESDATFSFQLTLDMDDAAFGADSPWYNGQEGKLVFWFGGLMLDDQSGLLSKYEGNMLLQGHVVPLPASILLFGSGLLGLFGVRAKSLYAKRG